MSSMSLPKDSDLNDYITQIIKASERGKKLINQILLFSRKDRESEKPIYIGPVVKEAMEFLKVSLPSTLEITTEYQQESFPVLIDSTRLHEVIINLVTNSSDAISEKGKLEISVTESKVEEPIIGRKRVVYPDKYTIITVRDNGAGMDDETIKNLFQPFFTTKTKGTGMGLAVVYGIVKHSSGEIIVYSEIGKGTTFKIYLPQTDVVYEPETDDEVHIEGGKEQILLIDDEDIVLDSLAKILQNIGYTVYAYSDPKEALNFFKTEYLMIDLVITDQTMPIITGFELTKEILLMRPEMKIILITGFSKNLTKEKALDSGVKMILRKPFDIKELTTNIREVLDNDLPFHSNLE